MVFKKSKHRFSNLYNCWKMSYDYFCADEDSIEEKNERELTERYKKSELTRILKVVEGIKS